MGEEPFIEERRSNNKILDGGETQQDILDLLQLNVLFVLKHDNDVCDVM